MMISIIVPMYHGKKYLKHILQQIEACAKKTENARLELVLYNDSPDEEISVCETGYSYDIKLIHPGFNSGIHGARVHGLEHAAGEYVLFLDQDDKIAPAYIQSQLECIGNADAVVCRLIHNNRLHYTNTHVFEKVISKDFMLGNWCSIVSPGQVLIKKTSIPQLWKDKILVNNGADDYFLWLLMFAENRTFSLNQEVLFEHILTGFNVSNDTNGMMDSELEMIQILKDNQVFSGEDEARLSRLPDSLRRIHIKELDNCKNTYFFFRCWCAEAAGEKPLIAFFEKHRIKRIAIYGAGDLGKSLELVLKDFDIEIRYFIDQNAEYIISGIPVYRKECMPGGVDAIVMSIRNKALEEELKNTAACPVYFLGDIININ